MEIEKPENWDQMSIEAKAYFLERQEAQRELAGSKSGEKFNRVVGGLAWPVARKPGVVVVVGEGRSVKHGRKPKYHILTDVKEFNVTKLVRSAFALGRRHRVDVWYGDADNDAMMQMMLRTKIILTITSPAVSVDGPEALGAYVAQIRELADAGNKRLYFGGSRLGAALQDIRLTDVRNTTRVTDFPEIASLGGVLCSLEAWPHDPHFDDYVSAVNASLADEYDDFEGE